MQFYQNQLQMQNQKKRRGISLAHKPTPVHQALDKSVYTQPTTRIQYFRYHVSNQPSRHASAPKTKVQFTYPINYLPTNAYTSNMPNMPINSHPPIIHPEANRYTFQSSDKPKTASLPIVQINKSIPQSFSHQTQVHESEFVPTELSITERYQSFEKCKEKISEKLFGKERVSSLTFKTAEQIAPQKQLLPHKSNNMLNYQQSLAHLEVAKKKKNLEISEVISYTQVGVSKISIQAQPSRNSDAKQIGFKEKIEQNKDESSASKTVDKRNALTLFNVNISPIYPETSKQQNKPKRDPLKLKEMEKRLMEIIKLCDQNMV